jgi:hypothetical protein
MSAFERLTQGSACHVVWMSEDRRSARVCARGKDALNDFQTVVREAEQAQERGELSIVLVHPIEARHSPRKTAALRRSPLPREFSSIVIVRTY